MQAPLDSVRLGELEWGRLPAGQLIKTPQALFPRIEADKAIERMRELEAQETARQAALFAPKPSEPVPPPSRRISIEEFARVDLRVGEVRFAERVKGSDKLLHLKVDIGEPEPRTIVAGIAEAYAPESLPGRKVVIVANLEPRKLRGIESNGMIVAATPEGGKPVLVGFLEDVPAGVRLS